MQINTNMQALKGARTLGKNSELLGRSLERLSSGSRILRPGDDPGGLATSERMTAQTSRIQAAQNNIMGGVSWLQTADGFAGEMHRSLTRMSELAMLARDPTKSSEDRNLYAIEFQAIQKQLAETVAGTGDAPPLGSFNGMPLFQERDEPLRITIGEATGQTLSLPETSLTGGAFGELIELDGEDFVLELESAEVDRVLRDSMEQISALRASLGAAESRLDAAGAALRVQEENLMSAVSRIRDVDVAAETTRLAKYDILTQAATAMLAQANQSPQIVLRLLQ